MTAVLARPGNLDGLDQIIARVTVRAAPRREPPFDDELTAGQLRIVGPLDQPLPFERPRNAREFTLVTPQSDMPDPAVWGRRLLVGIIESAAGKRPLQQLVGMLTPSIAQGLRVDFERAAQRRKPHWTHAATVRSIRATEPTPGVAEVCATVQAGTRVRAVAMRAEAHQGRWRCTRLQLG